MLSGIKQQSVVGKDGKIELQASELAEGTVVEVIILVEQSSVGQVEAIDHQQDTTDYLLSNEANKRHLMTSLQQLETRPSLISFTQEKWDEEHNLHS